MENLNEGKKKKGMTYEAALREIDAQSAIVAMEAKIEKLEEMAAAKEQRLSMVSEDENLSELISKSAVKEMQKEIKEIRKMQEKLKKVYEKKNGKLWDDPESVQENELLSKLIEKSKSKDKPLVVKNSKNQIIGVITQGDLLKAVVEGSDGE